MLAFLFQSSQRIDKWWAAVAKYVNRVNVNKYLDMIKTLMNATALVFL